ncbi:glycerol-3-phosphate O-acyltransferase [Phanerochaete sordida]|uniref:Glycerol-3-phosphate O-acyltransferase n=1 Tax=Phanerochaete sordida TaxID=48140 RepID=A0A9P3LHY8_9APHY|nr:glycerol-3-phosphate O-acyltransferase [Phanerochaete sordida]
MAKETVRRSSNKSEWVYDTALFFWKLVIYIFFREIRPRGAFHIPRDGPVIFVAAPHHNQFLDLLLALQVYRETGRRVQFLVAAASMQRKFIGFFARLFWSIPVVRAQDLAKPGIGMVSISDSDPCLVIGHGTRFTEEFQPRMQILLPKSVRAPSAEVVEVISDDKLRVKKPFANDNGPSTENILAKLKDLSSEGKDGLEFKKIPHVDQGETYQHVYDALDEGGCIAIFPEGGSHDRTDLLPLKAGVSLMALGAMAHNPDLKVKIVPVGLSYFHPHKFRSRVVVEFGHAMDVPPELVEKFQQGGAQKREAVGKFLDQIYDALKTVTIRAPDYETLMMIQAARRLYVTPGQHLTLGQVVELNKRFLEAYVMFKDEPRVQQLREDVLKYNRLLRDLGLRDHQVPGARKAGWRTFGLLCYRVLLLAVWSILALPGVVLNGPIFLTAKMVSIKKAKEALAASVVKVQGRDVLATWKVLISLGLTPVVYGFYAFLAAVVMYRAGAPMSWIIWTPMAVLAALPFIAYAALKFGEAGMDVLKSLRPLVLALAPGQQKYLDNIKAMRIRLSNELSEVINEYGPKVFEDFNETRILVPSASAPPSVNNGDWQRKGRDAQGRLLNHPMTWLDERLFGWSSERSRPSSPGGSDDDVADHDSLLFEMKPSSRTSSYADIRLRKTPVLPSDTPAHLVPNPTLDADGAPITPEL